MADPNGVPHYATLRTQPFGSRRAPSNWARVTQFLKWALSKFFGITIAVFVDDVHASEPLSTCDSAFRTVKALCALLGLVLDPLKETAPTCSLNLLGAFISVHSGYVDASLPERRRDELRNDVQTVLKNNRLTPALAAKLRGRLGFAQSLMFGRVGRAHLAVLSDRQYTQMSGTRFPLNDELRASLSWWVQFLSTPLPRRVYFETAHPVRVYSDASGAGHVGCVVIGPDGVVHRATSHLPCWLATVREKITEYELSGAILGLCVAQVLFPNLPVLLFCDNQGACGIVIRGSAKTSFGRALAAIFWNVAAINCRFTWVEYVRSAANLSDPDSRMCCLLGANAVPTNPSATGLPGLFVKIFESKLPFDSAKFKLPEHPLGFSQPFECPQI